MLDEEFAGSLEVLAATPTAALRARLLALPGVGPETADAILLYALGHPVPVADEYLRRIAERHQLLAPPPGHNRTGYESMADLTRQAFASDAPETRRGSSTSFMPSRSPSARLIAAEPPTVKVVRWPPILRKCRFKRSAARAARLPRYDYLT